MDDTPQQGNLRLAKLQKVPFFVWTHVLFFSDNICSVPNTQGGEETHTTLMPLSLAAPGYGSGVPDYGQP